MEKTIHIHVPQRAQDIVIFVHGFGVRWDSRGMFTDIMNALPSDWGSALFDLYKINKDHTYVTTFDDQVVKLKEVYSTVSTKHPESKIHVIAHSMGCIVTAVANLDVRGSIILLAPPEIFGTRLEEYFSSVPGSKQAGNYLIVPRKDGTTTHIPSKFFRSLDNVNPEEAMALLGEKHELAILQTTNDEVIGKTTYSKLRNNPQIKITKLPADHNFTNTFRSELIAYVIKELGIQP